MDTYNVQFTQISVPNQESCVLTGVHKMDFVLGAYVTVCRATMDQIVRFQCVHQENIMIMMQALA